ATYAANNPWLTARGRSKITTGAEMFRIYNILGAYSNRPFTSGFTGFSGNSYPAQNPAGINAVSSAATVTAVSFTTTPDTTFTPSYSPVGDQLNCSAYIQCASPAALPSPGGGWVFIQRGVAVTPNVPNTFTVGDINLAPLRAGRSINLRFVFGLGNKPTMFLPITIHKVVIS
ncbi:MAG: hypothetical protein ACRESO_09055, partial [Gammaproteobacteria bacterium]